MQLALDNETKSGQNLLFARGMNRDYMERSQKRPSYRAPEPPRRRSRRRKKLDIPYVCLTFLMLLVLYPIGLIMLWLRKIYWSGVTKMVITAAFAGIFVLLASFLLTVPVQNDTVTQVQASARHSLANAGTRMSEAWERADVTPEHLLKNVQDIAGYGIRAAQKGAATGIPVLKNNVDNMTQNVQTVAKGAAGLVAQGTKELMYKVNLMPTPEPTAEPTPEPTPEPTAAPTPEPTPNTLMAWYAQGDTLYHLSPDCEALQGREAESMAVTEAAVDGLMPCEDCAADAGIVEETSPPSDEGADIAPTGDEPTGDEPAGDEPTGDEPTGDEPIGDEPTGDEPIGDEPTGDEPAGDEPVGDAQPEATQAGPDAVVNTINDIGATEPAVSMPELDPTSVQTSPDPGEAAPLPTATPEPTPEPEPIVLPESKAAALATVYYTSNGKYYHTGPNCGSMKGAKPHTFKEAVDAGLKRCNGCGSPDPALLQESVVVWRGQDNVFHITDECEKVSEGKLTLMSLTQAMEDTALTGCTECGADLYAQVYRLYPVQETPIPASPIGG